MHLIEDIPARARRFRFTSAERLNRFVQRHADRAIALRATDFLRQRWPKLSAAPPRWRTNIASVAVVTLLALAAAVLAPDGTTFAFEVTLAVVFLAWLGLRLAGAFVKGLICDSSSGRPDDALPVYSVIAALYREAASVDGLLRARGTFTVIYDAEDRPESNQLRQALQAFRAGGGDLACVQARLCIDNSADSWLAWLFTAEYAGQFDVFLPGLAALRLPLPLGDSSNHFYGIR